MKRISSYTFVPLLLLALFSSSAVAQEQDQESGDKKCEGPVYRASDASRRAKIISHPVPEFTEEARVNNVRGRVVLSGVPCRTGRVTDIQVIESLPYGMTEKALETARGIEFTPAERDGQGSSLADGLKQGWKFLKTTYHQLRSG